MAHYYTPSGIDIDKVGIEPDVKVPEPTLNDKELEELQRLYDAGDIAQYLESNPQPTLAERKAFAAELAQKYKIQEIFIEKIIRDEAERSMPARIYDLEYDIQLQKALDLIESADFEQMLESIKTLAQVRASSN